MPTFNNSSIYFRYVSVDSHQGLIVKVAVTPANVHDERGLKHVILKTGAFFSSLRMPFEGVFSKMNKRARYRGNAKVQFQGFLQALAHNLKLQQVC